MAENVAQETQLRRSGLKEASIDPNLPVAATGVAQHSCLVSALRVMRADGYRCRWQRARISKLVPVDDLELERTWITGAVPLSSGGAQRGPERLDEPRVLGGGSGAVVGKNWGRAGRERTFVDDEVQPSGGDRRGETQFRLDRGGSVCNTGDVGRNVIGDEEHVALEHEQVP